MMYLTFLSMAMILNVKDCERVKVTCPHRAFTYSFPGVFCTQASYRDSARYYAETALKSENAENGGAINSNAAAAKAIASKSASSGRLASAATRSSTRATCPMFST